MPRPIILGVVGDSAAGKTTITRGLVRILGEEQVTHVGLDDYHRYDRKQRSERSITPLHPGANYMDIMEQHLRHLRAGEPILKPVYQHTDGTFGAPKYVDPREFAVLEGLLGYHTDDLCDLYDVRVYLAPPEPLRRKWKVDRDCSRRGYTTDQVLTELDRREADSAEFIRPQQRRADMVVSFQPAQDGGAALDAELLLRPDLPHPDLAPFVESGRGGISVEKRDEDRFIRIPADVAPDDAAAIEEAVWQKMHFARHLRTEHLGEYTVGTELHRSETLAIVQVLVLYHLVTAKATVALGGNGARNASEQEQEEAPEPADAVAS